MKNRSQSETKLRQVYTSRIKDGRRSNDFAAMKNNYMSAQKLPVYNPQSPRPKIKQQCHHNRSQIRVDNPPDKYDLIKTQAQSPVKRIAAFEPPKINKFQDRKQQTINGRKLEYPHESYRNAGYYPYQQKNVQVQTRPKTQRPHSASYASTSSKHYVDRTVKSRQVKQKHAIDSQKIRVAMNYLLQTNDDYLDERARVCSQKARPKQQIFKIQLANTPSTYRQHYPPKKAEHEIYMQPQNQKTALSLGPRKVTGNSTTHQFHNGVQGPKADMATWPDGFKLQGPMDGTTTYANHFPNYGDYEKMVPVATFNEHPMGMTFNTTSTHKDHFRGEQYPKAQLATWNNMHPYGNDFDPNRSTTYRSFHNSKQKQPIQQWPNYDPRLLVSKGKFSTEYKSEMKKFNEHKINHGNHCKCSWHKSRSGRKRIYD